MAKEYRTIRNDVALPYQWALGKTWTRFFDGLKEEKILGTKCTQCGKVFVPARTFCPECFTDMMQWVEAGKEPASITGQNVVDGAVKFSRPLCPYPQVAHYGGTGTASSADSFECSTPQ